jgi:HNH endonuclease
MDDIATTAQDEPAKRATPLGYCECGCGQRTNLAPRNRRDRGWIKGKPLRWLRGHATRKQVRYVETPSGYDSPCWIWQLAKNYKGYGLDSDSTGKTVLAHRRYYEQHNGPIQSDRQLDHLCRVRACVNPDHLEAVTSSENARRGLRTKLTPKAVAEIRSSTEKQFVLARRYGVGQGHISRIKNNHTWRDTKSGGLA